MMFGIGIAAMSGLFWLASARILYGRWRITSQEHAKYGWKCWAGHSSYSAHQCCFTDARNRQKTPDGYLAAAAMLCALAFPVVLLVALVRYKPPKSAKEVEAERVAFQKRIKQLEKELKDG